MTSIVDVQDLSPRAQYTASGGQTVFPYPFPIFEDDNLVVYDNDTLQVLTTHYTVSGAGNDTGGNVTFTSGRTAGHVITIYRDIPIERTSDFQTNGPFASASMNDELDRITLVLQQLESAIGRSLRIPKTTAVADSSIELSPIANWLNKFVFIGATGAPEPATSVTTTPLTQSIIAALLTPQTPAESSAGVTPLHLQYVPGDIRRYWTSGDVETAVENACAANKRVVLAADGATTYTVAGTIDVDEDDIELVIPAGVTLSHTTGTVKGLNVTGANFKLSGPGTLKSVNTAFDGTNAPRTFAVVWLAGADPEIDSVRFLNVPRCGIRLENVAKARIHDNRIIGNFPYASYGGVNTGHLAIDIDCPTTATVGDDVGLVIANNVIETSVQGVFYGNTGSVATEAGIDISGNTFVRCWDHGVYGSLSEGVVVGANTFLSTHKPVVVDGFSCSVVGNVCYSTEATNSNGQQVIQVREARGCVVTGNTLYGLGAAIYLDCTNDATADTISDNIVSNNTIIRTGAGDAESAIRLGFFTEICANNVIENNVIQGGNFTSTVGVIQLEMKAAFTGLNNIVRNNTINSTGVSNGVHCVNHDGVKVSGNSISMTGSAGGATTIRAINIDTCLNANVDDNTVLYPSGGTNVTIRGIQTTGTCTGSRFTNNKFRLSSGSLAGSDALGFIGALFQTGNVVSGGTALATNATENFAYVPTCAGTPTGAASVYTGLAAVVIDSTNHKLYFRSGGAWRDAGP